MQKAISWFIIFLLLIPFIYSIGVAGNDETIMITETPRSPTIIISLVVILGLLSFVALARKYIMVYWQLPVILLAIAGEYTFFLDQIMVPKIIENQLFSENSSYIYRNIKIYRARVEYSRGSTAYFAKLRLPNAAKKFPDVLIFKDLYEVIRKYDLNSEKYKSETGCIIRVRIQKSRDNERIVYRAFNVGDIVKCQ